ncbi:hypothetical protein NPIL_388801 [Nephila pilipes]|uniref:Uncharacterized protein n=1 Tax=Nephila pilipes TaxID=299642 RepID=A0A8X6MPQ7_NEPPI|nr:hypothetical protein NPIL_388801 [Nephila pilipes]
MEALSNTGSDSVTYLKKVLFLRNSNRGIAPEGMDSKNPRSVRKMRSEAWSGDASTGYPGPAGRDCVTYLKEVITLEKKKVPIKPGKDSRGRQK